MQPNVQIAQEMPDVTAVANTQVYFPDASSIKAELSQLQTTSATYQAARAEIQARNLLASDQATAQPFGYTMLDESTTGQQARTFNIVEDLGSSDGKDFGLVGVLISGTDERGFPVRKELFELVEKPSSGITDPSQVTVVATFRDGAAMSPGAGVTSVFSAFVDCVKNSCATVCLGSLTACAGAFPVYLKCVAVACGGCALKCGACVACDCGFWCKWATGCCNA